MQDESAKIVAALTAAAEGLLVPSEQDVALALFRWPQREQFTPARLVAALGLPPATLVETRTLDSFFAPLTRTHTALAPDEQAQAARFATLRDLIVAHRHDGLSGGRQPGRHRQQHQRPVRRAVLERDQLLGCDPAQPVPALRVGALRHRPERQQHDLHPAHVGWQRLPAHRRPP